MKKRQTEIDKKMRNKFPNNTSLSSSSRCLHIVLANCSIQVYFSWLTKKESQYLVDRIERKTNNGAPVDSIDSDELQKSEGKNSHIFKLPFCLDIA